MDPQPPPTLVPFSLGPSLKESPLPARVHVLPLRGVLLCPGLGLRCGQSFNGPSAWQNSGSVLLIFI